MQHSIICAAAFAALLLAGCGGDGGKRDATTTFRVPIDWAARTRALSGPASASSVTVTLVGAGANHLDIVATTNRGDGADARTTVATSLSPAAPGTWPMTIRFTTGPDGSGDLVATASATVHLAANGEVQNSDGTPLSGVTNTSAITTVEIAPDQKVPLLQTVPLEVTARNAEGDVVAVPPAAIQLAVTLGNAVEVVGGRLKGVSLGLVTVEASIDGVKSDGSLIATIRPPAAVHRVEFAARGLAFNGVTNRLYSPVGPSFKGFTKELVTIDPATAVIGGRVDLGEEGGGQIAVSSDGSTAYVANGELTRVFVVDLRTGTLTNTINVGSADPSRTLNSIAVSPVDPTLVAMTIGTRGLVMYHNGQALPAPENALGVSGPMEFNAAGTAVYVSDGNGVVRAEANTSGVGTIIRGPVPGGVIAVRGNRVFLSSGEILDAQSLQSLGRMSTEQGLPISGVAITPSGDRAFFLTGNSSLASPAPTILVYDTRTFEKIEEYSISMTRGPWFNFLPTGERSLALTTVLTPFSNPGVVTADLPQPSNLGE